jgi:hypothetical protein
MQNFSSPASTQTDLETFLIFFQVNFRMFKKIPEFLRKFFSKFLKVSKSEYAILSLN